jgi:hypothetical protein
MNLFMYCISEAGNINRWENFTLLHFNINVILIILQIILQFCTILGNLKVHKHEIFFLTFFAETESLWSQGPVTRDF